MQVMYVIFNFLVVILETIKEQGKIIQLDILHKPVYSKYYHLNM